MTTLCTHFYISGKVQGVFFRENTCSIARNLSLTGWIRNLKDGRVEIVACGEPAALEKLKQWLWEGPPNAEVEAVFHEDSPQEFYANFEVVRE